MIYSPTAYCNQAIHEMTMSAAIFSPSPHLHISPEYTATVMMTLINQILVWIVGLVTPRLPKYFSEKI